MFAAATVCLLVASNSPLTVAMDLPKPVTYQSASGPVKWRWSPSKIEWADKILNLIDFNNYSLEATFSSRGGSLQAWDTAGSLYSDFEGYMRLQLNLHPELKVKESSNRKNRMVVVRISSQNPPHSQKENVYVSGEVGEDNEFQKLNSWLSFSPYSLHYVPLEANPEDGWASIPMRVWILMRSKPVIARPGVSFTFAGNKYSILAIRSFKKSDNHETPRPKSESKYFTSIVVKQVDARPAIEFSGYVSPPPFDGTNFRGYWRLDSRGNFYWDPHPIYDPTEMPPNKLNTEFELVKTDNESRTFTFVTGPNPRWVKSLIFSSSFETTVWLDNIPLDPKAVIL